MFNYKALLDIAPGPVDGGFTSPAYLYIIFAIVGLVVVSAIVTAVILIATKNKKKKNNEE